MISTHHYLFSTLYLLRKLIQQIFPIYLSILSICQNGTIILVAKRRVLLVGKVEELWRGGGGSNEGSLRLPVRSLVVCIYIYIYIYIEAVKTQKSETQRNTNHCR